MKQNKHQVEKIYDTSQLKFSKKDSNKAGGNIDGDLDQGL
jgi:hypothetical protein